LSAQRAGRNGGKLAADFARRLRFWIKGIDVAGAAELEQKNNAPGRRLGFLSLGFGAQELGQAQSSQPQPADLQEPTSSQSRLQKISAAY
jgi:hypothetical protein